MPKIVNIDWDELDKLCFLQCTQLEIAGFFNCSVDTIENRVKKEHGMLFSEYYKQKSQGGKIALRRKQYQVAMSGNATMLIWLGKQKTWLNQSEKSIMEVAEGSRLVIDMGGSDEPGEDQGTGGVDLHNQEDIK